MPSTADLAVGVLIILIYAILQGSGLLSKIAEMFSGGSCEEVTRSDIRNLMAKANTASLGNQEISYKFNFNDKCVDRLSATGGILSVKFKSETEPEKFADSVFFEMSDVIVNPGTYKVNIAGNKVEITDEKIS